MSFKKPDLKNPNKVSLLDIKCTSTSCGDNLHCFKPLQKLIKEGKGGTCRDCGADLIDWKEVHNRDISTVEKKFEMLKLELIRHEYWHAEPNEKAIKYGLKKGRVGLKERANTIFSGKSFRPKCENAFDGRQTPMEGNIINYAQHATACCCRTCMSYWHDVDENEILTENQINYFVKLIMLYVDEKMEGYNLTENGIKVPRKSSLEAFVL